MRNILLLLAFTALTACESRELIYEDYRELPETGWHQDSLLTYSVQVNDPEQHYFIRLHLRHNQQYPFANLYLFREITHNHERAFSDTVNITLADEYGEWHGSGFGDLRTLEIPYRAEPVRFKAPGNYIFRLGHGMRTEVLPGIRDVGLSLEIVPSGDEQNNQ